MEPVSPIRKLRPIDRTQEDHLYRAVDTQSERIRFLHLSGQDIVDSQRYAWLGTKKQFENLCSQFEWDALKLVPIRLLRH